MAVRQPDGSFSYWRDGLPAIVAGATTTNPNGFRYWRGGMPVALEGVQRLLSVTPITGRQGTAVTVAVLGSNTNFVDGVTIATFNDPNITVLSTTVIDATHATVHLVIAPGTATTAHDVTLSTIASATLMAAFTVTASIFAGTAVKIGLGGLDPNQLIFAGEIQDIDQIYEDLLTNQAWDAKLIDYTFLLNRRRPFGTWVDVSATTIGRYVVAVFGPGFTANGIEEGLPNVTINFDGLADFGSCMTTLAAAFNGQYAGPDYDKDVHLFLTPDTSDAPDPIDLAHPPLNDPPIIFSAAIDQVRTRVYGKGHGETTPTDLPAGSVILPIADAVMFDPAGGQAIAGLTSGGAQTQVLSYESVQLGGASAVGPGLAAATAPVLAPASGVGIEDGVHQYAYTDVTAAGETEPGPIASITTGPLAAPLSAPVPGTPTIGVGPDLGSHDYAVTLVTAAGETTPSPLITKVIDASGVPPTMATPTATSGGSVDPGVHRYATTFVTAAGETMPSTTVQVTTSIDPHTPPLAPKDNGQYYPSGDLSDGVYQYATTLTYPSGETVPGAILSLNPRALLDATGYGPGLGQSLENRLSGYTGGALCWNLYRTVANGSQLKLAKAGLPMTNNLFIDTLADAALGADPPTGNIVCTVPLQGIPIGGAGSGVLARNLYRTVAGGMELRFLHQLADDSTATWTDTAADSTLGAVAPTVNAAYFQQVPIAVPAASALVTSRNVYRTVLGGSQLKLVGAVAGNGAASLVDTVPDASLGADAPTINTAAVNQVQLSGILAGQTTVTARNLYRTAAGATQLKFLHQLADNSTTTWTDTAADSTLGADAPIGDTSGLSQPPGQVLAGSPTLIVANPGAASAIGGWAIVNNQAVRYTGIAGHALTGIPVSGVGALTTTVLYSSAVRFQPALVGINHWNGIPVAMAKGSAVHIWVQRDDLEAQAALAILEGGDGIREYTLTDERRGEVSLIAVCDADLAKMSRPIVSSAYCTRDPKTRSGKTVSIDLAFSPWGISKDFTIQTVGISEIDIAPDLYPLYSVSASSVAFSLSDLLRRMQLA